MPHVKINVKKHACVLRKQVSWKLLVIRSKIFKKQNYKLRHRFYCRSCFKQYVGGNITVFAIALIIKRVHFGQYGSLAKHQN